MACTVYREGTGTIEHGIECESTTVEHSFLESMLAGGWMLDPPGYVAPEPVIEEPVEASGSVDSGDGLLEVLEENDRLTAEVERLTKVEDNLTKQVEKLNEMLAAHKEEPADDNLNPVRLAAKEAGIEGWDTKRIGTLEKLLEA